jgi:methyl-accepting chemotaxis protein
VAGSCTTPAATGGAAGLGPFPDGDPEAIRALAADLRRMAGRLAGVPSPALTGWRGPAATQVTSLLTSAVHQASGTAGELRACASSLDHAAHTLEADQRAWRQAKQRAEDNRP